MAIMDLKILAFLACLIILNSGCSQHKHSKEVSYPLAKNAVFIENKTLTSNDLWNRLRHGLKLRHHYNHPELDKKKHWDQDQQLYINKITERGKRYIFHIIGELEANNIPLEIALLPAIESGYNPLSYSSKHAGGLWQFIPPTARLYELKNDSWYDARIDPIKSTSAAIDYLQYLHKRFNGDWLLALAAYNGGEGTVRRAIRKNQKEGRPTDFWSLKLPAETTSYVPRLLILSRIISNPSNYSVTLPGLANQPYFESVTVSSQINLSKAAEMAGIQYKEMRLLNPAYKLGTTHPEQPHLILLPVDSKQIFLNSLEKIPKKEWSAITIHKVLRGDTLSLIALKHKISIKSLMQRNNIHSHIIQIGQKIKIPGTGLDINDAKKWSIYTVQDGDSLWQIAKQNKVSIKDIAKWNDLNLNLPLQIGKKIELHIKQNLRTD